MLRVEEMSTLTTLDKEGYRQRHKTVLHFLRPFWKVSAALTTNLRYTKRHRGGRAHPPLDSNLSLFFFLLLLLPPSPGWPQFSSCIHCITRFWDERMNICTKLLFFSYFSSTLSLSLTFLLFLVFISPWDSTVRCTPFVGVAKLSRSQENWNDDGKLKPKSWSLALQRGRRY